LAPRTSGAANDQAIDLTAEESQRMSFFVARDKQDDFYGFYVILG